jgi:hypothetical protein
MKAPIDGIKPGKRMRTRRGRRLRVEAFIGAGNEGAAYHAQLDGQPHVVKLFKMDCTGRRRERTRALVQLDLSRNLTQQLAAPFDEVDWEGHVGHVATFVPGLSMQELIDQPALLTPRQRVLATIKLGALLARVHGHGLAFGDLNKGAIKLQPLGPNVVDVGLVDLDSLVMPGQTLPMTLGTPDTSAPELRDGRQPKTVAAWQAADWTAFGHVALELLLAKTAACGIDEPLAQIQAFLDVPPCLRDTPQGRRVDGAAGLSAAILPLEVRRAFARLFDRNTAHRDGPGFVKALTSALVNNHQVACNQCGMQYFAHEQLSDCPGCGSSTTGFTLYLANGMKLPLSKEGLVLTGKLLNSTQVRPRHARLFMLGPVVFVCAYAPTAVMRRGVLMQLTEGIHVPLVKGDRVRLTGSVEVLVQ